MLDKMYKVSVIVIACFIVVAGVVLILPTSEATAQSFYHKDRDKDKNKDNNVQMIYSVPESHVWELQGNHFFNKATGEIYYLANDRQGNRKLIKYTRTY